MKVVQMTCIISINQPLFASEINNIDFEIKPLHFHIWRNCSLTLFKSYTIKNIQIIHKETNLITNRGMEKDLIGFVYWRPAT